MNCFTHGGWGTNVNGVLCDGTDEHRPRPVQMTGIANAVNVVVDINSIVVLADGTLCGWGMGWKAMRLRISASS